MVGQRGEQLIRAFIAITPGEGNLPGIRSTILNLQSGPQGDAVRWVRTENLHVTLRFLGNIPEEKVAPLHRSIVTELAGHSPFDLSVGPAGLFPRGKRPRVVAAALEPEQPLLQLATAVNEAVQAAGLPGEDRTFRAHLTLGRIKRNAPRSMERLSQRIDQVNQEQESPAPSHRIDRVVLFRSDLKPDGPVYTELWAVLPGGHCKQT